MLVAEPRHLKLPLSLYYSKDAAWFGTRRLHVQGPGPSPGRRSGGEECITELLHVPKVQRTEVEWPE